MAYLEASDFTINTFGGIIPRQFALVFISIQIYLGLLTERNV